MIMLPPERWEVGMLVKFRKDEEWAWIKDGYGRIVSLREECADRHGSEYQVFYTTLLSGPNDQKDGFGTFWTTPNDVDYIQDKAALQEAK
jgi:hypothetical protein